VFYVQPHCTENPIYVFPETKLRGLVPNSYIHSYFVTDPSFAVHTLTFCTFPSNYPTYNVALFCGRSPYQVPAQFMDLYSQEEDVYTQVLTLYIQSQENKIFTNLFYFIPLFSDLLLPEFIHIVLILVMSM
jgi:hypothetical protein